MSADSKNSHTEASGELRDSPFLFYIVTWDQPQDVLCGFVCIHSEVCVCVVFLREYVRLCISVDMLI